MQIIDGKKIAQSLRADIAKEVKGFSRPPGLAVILVGHDPASEVYVRNKAKACVEVGFYSDQLHKSANITQEELLSEIRRLNDHETIDGILVQLPLPDGINEEEVLSSISIEKDVDGFHPVNIGKLGMKGRDPLFVPCTPDGCIRLLQESGAEFSGANAVVLGRSNIVGLPAAMLLLKRNATLTVCHSRTRNLPEVCRQADILIAAVGRPEMVKGDWVKPGAFVIDVGINNKWIIINWQDC